jgi:hypothetical protein
MTESRCSVVHVRLTSDRPFGDVKAAFERRLGRFEPYVYQSLAEDGDLAAVRARLEATAGSSGFMLFCTSDHGRLRRLVGQQRYAVQNLIGDPLFAVEMPRHATGAAHYAALRVLIYETDGGKTCIAYARSPSRPASLGMIIHDVDPGRTGSPGSGALTSAPTTARSPSPIRAHRDRRT